MNIYERGKIYKLVSYQTEKIYIGSTCCSLSKRKGQHKGDYKCWLNGKCGYMTSFDIVKCGDVDIILIENFSCNDKNQLRARERHYIETLDCVNKRIPTRTKAEYYIDNKEEIRQKQKEYNMSHKEEIRQNQKEYHKANKEKLNQQVREWRVIHKEESKQKRKVYLTENKDEISQRRKIKMTCECGSIFRKITKARHFRTKKHKTYLDSFIKSNGVSSI